MKTKTIINSLESEMKERFVLSTLLPTQKTTQAFNSAEDMAAAFKGELEKMPNEIVDKQVKKIRANVFNLIKMKMHGISNEDLVQILQVPWIYSRLTNPISQLLEKNINDIENAKSTAVFASGMAAITAALNQFTSKNEKITVIESVYGGTHAQLKELQRDGQSIEFISLKDFEKNGLPQDTKTVFFETCTNPTLEIMPIKDIVSSAKNLGAKTICDNTFTPLSVRPLDNGVDLSLHSMTKYMNGKSEDLGGSISGKEEDISALLGLHGGKRMVDGGVMAPRVAQEFLKNMKDLPERLFKASENARKVKNVFKDFGLDAKFIEDSENFNQIKDLEISENSISNGMVGIHFPSKELAYKFVNEMIRAGVGKGAVSLGGKETYYCISADTTSSELEEKELEERNITPGYVRLSCGIEKNLDKKIKNILTKICAEKALSL